MMNPDVMRELLGELGMADQKAGAEERKQELAKSADVLSSNLSAVTRSFYEACLGQGFSEDQSLKLAQAYMQTVIGMTMAKALTP